MASLNYQIESIARSLRNVFDDLCELEDVSIWAEEQIVQLVDDRDVSYNDAKYLLQNLDNARSLSQLLTKSLRRSTELLNQAVERMEETGDNW